MSSKFSRSGVFSSPVDYFCLACECRLHNEHDANMHIVKPVHTKNFDSTDYFEKNKEDCVRKIKKWYFCEFCNHLLSTSARVRLHVTEPKHIENKTSQYFHRKGNFIVAFDNVLISDKAWNGIINNTCVICNTEFEDENIHKNEAIHIIKLIQSKAEFETKKNIFRKIDDSSFQCLTCNTVVALNEIELHFNQIEHIKLYQQNRELEEIEVSNSKDDKKEILDEAKLFNKPEYDSVNNFSKTDNDGPLENLSKNINRESGKERQNQQSTINEAENEIHDNTWKIEDIYSINKVEINEKPTPTNDTTVADNSTAEENIDSRGNILNFIDKFQKSDINLKVESQTAAGEKWTKELDFNVQSIEDHIEEHAIKIEQKVSLKIEEASCKSNSLHKTLVLFKSTNEEDLKRNNLDLSNDKECTTKEIEEERATFVKENNMKYTDTKSKVFCNRCNSNIPSSLRNLKEHVAGLAHKSKANRQDFQIARSKPKPKQSDKEDKLLKIRSKSFLRSVVTVDRLHKDVILNEVICINLFSFSLVVNHGSKLNCLVCRTKFHVNRFRLHAKLSTHNDAVNEAHVILFEQSNEFVREIRPGCFHCGYCNLTQPSWDAMEDHLLTTAHKESKKAAQWRLQQYRALIMRSRLEIQDRLIMNMFFNTMFLRWNTRYDTDSD